MLNALKSFLSGQPAPARDADAELRAAACALLVETALMDGQFDQTERDTIARLLGSRFGLNLDGANALIDDALAVESSDQLYPVTRTIKERFDAAQRIEMMEMLWEIVYADGRLHDYEANLARRVAGLIYVPDADAGAARLRVLARLGLDGGAL